MTATSGSDRSGAPGAPATRIDISAFSHPRFSFGGNLARLYGLVPVMLLAVGSPFLLWALLEALFPWIPFDVLRIGALALVLLIIALLVYGLFRLLSWLSGSRPLGSELLFDRDRLVRELPHAGITLGEALAQVRAFIARQGEAVEARDGSKAGLAWGYRLLALLLVGLAVSTAFLEIDPPALQGAVLGGAVGGGTFVAMLLWIRAGRALQPSVALLREQDRRRPVLLLRSFRDDRIGTFRRIRLWPWDVDYNIRFEQAIAGSLARLGPLIAIGAPGEKLPQIGAARVYLRDDEWQDQVSAWIDESLLIVMIAGPTEWIRWELHRIREQERLRHLVILVPPDSGATRQIASRRERWDNVCRSFEGTAWETTLGSIDLDAVLAVQLAADGGVVAITSSNTLVQDYQLALAVAVHESFCRASA